MKEEVFNAYANQVMKLFKVSKDELFSSNKRRDLVDARYLLYFLCYTRPMRICYIQEYMGKNGHEPRHTSIIHGIKQVKQRIREDEDYVHIIRTIEQKCAIM